MLVQSNSMELRIANEQLVKLNNNGVKNATAFGSITGLGSMIFIKKLTASHHLQLYLLLMVLVQCGS